MAEPRIRLRNPFRFDGILDVDQGTPDRILDEQEQEHIVEELKKENVRLEEKYTRLGIIVLFVSMTLQILSFLGITTDAGLASRAFNILNILLHMHAIYVLREQKTVVLAENTVELPPFLPVQLLVLVQPVLLLLQSADVSWVEISPPTLATLVAWICLSAVEEGRRGVEGLGGLMYAAKGA